MDKFRAIVIYTMNNIRECQGEGELLCDRHIYYEAVRVLERNGWMAEAEEDLKKELVERRKKLEPTIEEYYQYLISGETDEEYENTLLCKFHNYNINGREEDIVKYRATHNNEVPTGEELRELVRKRQDEDRRNRKIFFDAQVAIYFCEPYDKEELNGAVKYLKKRGIYKVTLKEVMSSITREEYKRICQANGVPGVLSSDFYDHFPVT